MSFKPHELLTYNVAKMEVVFVCLFVFCLSCFLEREKYQVKGEGEERRKRGNLTQAPCSVPSPTQGSIPQPWDHNLSQNQESDAQETDLPQASHDFILFNEEVSERVL